jgi:hypothetical protein
LLALNHSILFALKFEGKNFIFFLICKDIFWYKEQSPSLGDTVVEDYK